MRSDKDNIKNIFSSKLSSFEPELPPSLWEKIDADLSAQQTVKPIPIYRYIGWVASVAAIFLLLLLVFPKVLFEKSEYADMLGKSRHINMQINRASTDSYIVETIKKVEEEKIIPLASSAKKSNNKFLLNAIAENKYLDSTAHQESAVKNNSLEINNISSDSLIIGSAIVENELDATQNNTFVADNTIQPEEAYEVEDLISFDAELAKKIAAFEAEGHKGADLLTFYDPIDDNSQYDLSPSSSRGIELGLSGGSSGITKSQEVKNQLRMSSLVEYSNGDDVVTEAKPQKIKLEHSQPISFGLTINRRINNRISLETGLLYIYLSSRAKSVAGSDLKARDSQYFHYLGIPLAMNYKLVEWNKLQVYLSVGGMVQKDFYGKMSTQQSIKDFKDTKELLYKTISQDNPQFSLTGSLGFSYPIYKRFSFYTNLGAAYYFRSDNNYETIYSDRRWIFNFSGGIKLGF